MHFGSLVFLLMLLVSVMGEEPVTAERSDPSLVYLMHPLSGVVFVYDPVHAAVLTGTSVAGPFVTIMSAKEGYTPHVVHAYWKELLGTWKGHGNVYIPFYEEDSK